MLIFIFFGTKHKKKTIDFGSFHCPQCQQETPYRRRSVNQALSVYFIPVASLGEVSQYIECLRCFGTFKPEVLDYSPAPTAGQVEAEYKKAIKTVMVLMMTQDGLFRPSEVESIQKGYHHLTGIELSTDEINRHAHEVWNREPQLLDYLSGVARYLNSAGKEQVLRAAIFVAASDDDIADEERKLADEIGKALRMTRAHVHGVIHEMIG